MASPSALTCNIGVSCDICKKSSFSGLRYKCLICYDYDLCAQCYDEKLVSNTHLLSHPTQCIVPTGDHEIYYAGEPILEQSKSFTCPLCGLLGFSKTSLAEHVTSDHLPVDNGESSIGVVCPICCADKIQYIFDFPTHLAMEHKTNRDQVEQLSIRGRGGRCARTNRGRRSQYTNIDGGTNSSAASNRESTEHLVEILAHLSNVRRSGSLAQSPASQQHLQQLQMHLQSSPSFTRPATTTTTTNTAIPESLIQPSVAIKQTIRNDGSPTHRLLSKCIKPIITEKEQQQRKILQADRSLFAQELLMQIGSIKNMQ